MNDIQVDHDFPGGGADHVHVAGSHVTFAAPTHGCPQPMWFALRVRGAAGRRVTFTLANGSACLGGSQIRVTQPVYREPGGRWRRVAQRDCRWDEAAGALHFALRAPGDEVFVASCYPYQLADFTAFLAQHPHPHRRLMPTISSPHGRQVPLLEVTDPDREGPKQLVWLTARHHAGEIQGSYVAEGLVTALLAATPWAARVRREFIFCLAPIVDVDAVEEGSYGKDQPPVDFNRDWTSLPHHPAVHHLRASITATAAQHQYVLFCDLHGPAPADPSFFVVPKGVLSDPASWAAAWVLPGLVEQEAPTACPCRVADWPPHAWDWSHENAECVSTESQRREHGVTALTLETTYHRAWNGHLVRPDDWRRLGAALLRGIVRWRAGDTAGPAPAPPVPVLRHWRATSLVCELRLAEAEGTLSLTPMAAGNGVWLEPATTAAAPLVLRTHLEAATAVEVGLRIYRYDAAGVRLRGWDTASLPIGPGEHSLRLAPQLDGAAAWRPALLIHNLPGALQVTLT